MGKLKDYKAYLEGVKAGNADINKVCMLEDPAEWTTFVQDLDSSDNYVLCAVIPSFGNNSPSSADEYQPKLFGEILILDKVDVSCDSQDAYIEAFDDALVVIEAVRDQILSDHNNGCGFLKKLNAGSIQIVTFSTSQVKGWNLIFTFDVDV
jgi:hypothetical protein